MLAACSSEEVAKDKNQVLHLLQKWIKKVRAGKLPLQLIR
jgi:hypothetical protein